MCANRLLNTFNVLGAAEPIDDVAAAFETRTTTLTVLQSE
jgi:hypothetical protein